MSNHPVARRRRTILSVILTVATLIVLNPTGTTVAAGLHPVRAIVGVVLAGLTVAAIATLAPRACNSGADTTGTLPQP